MAAQLSNDSVDSSGCKRKSLDDLRQTCEFSKKTWKEDMAFVVEDRKLFVSSSTLALVSPVFEAKFEEAFKEGDSRQVILGDEKYDDVVEFLRCVYPNILKAVSKGNVLRVLPLAEKFQVQALIEKCEKFLIEDIDDRTDGSTLGQYLQNACTYGMEKVIKKCVETASEKNSNYLRQAEQHKIPKETMLEIRDKMIKDLENKLSSSESKVYRLEREVRDLEESTNVMRNNVAFYRKKLEKQ